MRILKNLVTRAKRGYILTHYEEEPRPIIIPSVIQQPGIPQIPSIPPIKIQAEFERPEIQPITITTQFQSPKISPIRIPIQPFLLPMNVPAQEASPEFQSRMEAKVGSFEGFNIPEFSKKGVKMETIEHEEVGERISLTYPLIPTKPKKGDTVFAYAKIYWDEKVNQYVYNVIEPPTSLKLKDITRKVKELLEEKLDIDFSKLNLYEAKEYLKKQINEITEYYSIRLNPTEKVILQYYIERDYIGIGKIEPFAQDEQIEDISCDGVGIPIFVFHRNPKLGSLATNVAFDNADELDSFVTKLAQISGKSISVATPLLNGALPDGSRIQATLATDIARRGSNFTIRKFTEKPLTPIHLLNYGTIDVKMMAYLWTIVDYGKSIIVSGGTASGKTSFLNVLSLFIRPEKKIVSIEDTPELKLPHPHWIPQVARTAISVEETRKVGEVDLFDLLKESLRQRPDYIIVGEVRGKEAYVLFQEMATGHPSLATIHAENMPKLLDRLTTPPISLPPSLIASVDVISFLLLTRYKDKQVRRVNEILEVIRYDSQAHMPIVNQVFKWNPMNDKFDVVGKSVILKRIAESRGMTEKEMADELERRMLVLNWMKFRNFTEYTDVHNVVTHYYNFPEKVLAAISQVM